MDEQDILAELLKDYATVPDHAAEKEDTASEEPSEAPTDSAEPMEEEPPVEEEPAVEEEPPAKEEIVEEVSVEEETVEEEPADEELRVAPLEAPTQVITLSQTAETEPPTEDEVDDGQITMAELAGEEEPPVEETPEEMPDWEEQLIKTRQEKIRDFQIKQNRENLDFRFAGDAAPDEEPEREPEKEEPEAPEEEPQKERRFTGDFTDFSQAEDVRAELQHRHRSGTFRMWLAAAAGALLLWSDISVIYYGQPTLAPSLFLLLNLLLLACMAILLYPMLRDGTTALLHGKPTAETVPAIVTAAVLLHTLVQWSDLAALEAGEARLFTSLAALSLLLCGMGRMAKLDRIRQNFTLVSHDTQKFAAVEITDERAATEIGRRAVVTGVPRVAFFRPVRFLDDFLANAYMDDRYDRIMSRFLPIAGGVCLVIGIIAGVSAKSAAVGFSALVGALCVLLPAAPLALNVPLFGTCRRLLREDDLLCSYAAAERFGKLHGVALDVSDLYRQDSVALHGIRTFCDTRIDEAIMDAAAVAIRTDGPLAGLFLRIIEERTEILPAVENLVFEQDMGFSGWVGGRRVLVGNRKLLENHGVDTPSGDYERKYKKDNRELVYLSVGGALSAMFIISYLADPEVEEALHELQDAHLSLLIRSCDPNVTEESLCAGFHLDDYYVDLLSASAGRLYDGLRHENADRVSAGAAVNGKISGIAALLTACRRLKRRGTAAMVTQIALSAVGALWCLGAAFSGGILSAVAMLLFLPVAALLSILLPLIVR